MPLPANTLVVSPTGGASTLAVKAQQVAANIEFTPAATSPAPGCAQLPDKTSCPATLASAQLRFQGGVLAIEVSGVATTTMTFVGGPERDTVLVAGPPEPGPPSVGTLALDPGLGNDSVTVSGSVGTITQTGADVGDDRYTINSNSPAAGTLDLGPGNDVASSSAQNLTLSGGTGDDTLSGAGPLFGGDGSDILKPTQLGQVASGGDGGSNVDRLSYEQLPSAVALTKTTPSEVVVDTDLTTKLGIEEVEGSRFADTLAGHAGADTLIGGDGDDLIEGRGGGDTLDGGPGLNTVSYAGAPGFVTVDLGAGQGVSVGTDTLRSFRGVIASAGNDTITGTTANEIISAGAGNDIVNAGPGEDTIDGGPGNDLLRGGYGRDTITGGADRDTATYDERSSGEPVSVTLATPGDDGATGENDTLTGIEDVVGGASNDTLAGDDGPNALSGGPGLNTLDGLGGDDVITGGEQRDVISGGAGHDALYGLGDDDSINAYDSEADTVDCGSALDDDAQVDAGDAVSGCEYSRRGDVPVPVDADADGFVAPIGGSTLGFDCNDRSASVNPAATDIVADGIDQDCDGVDEPRPYVDGRLTLAFSQSTAKGTRVTKMLATNLTSTHRVVITCKTAIKRYAKRCPFKKVTKTRPRNSQVGLTSLFKNRLLPPSTTIELRITAPGFNGKLRRLTVRATSVRNARTMCIPFGKTKAQRCPPDEE